ncbi:hypothetical protein ACXET9_05495 [Brachybacterium sp. DNPG3]
METSTVLTALLGILAILWILFRQLQPRRLRQRPTAPIVLIIIGLAQTSHHLDAGTVPAMDLLLLLASLAVGAALALCRAALTRLWIAADGTAMRQGTWATVVLWIVSIASHLGIDALQQDAGLGTASLLVYLGVILLVQQGMLLVRATGRGILGERSADAQAPTGA